MAFYDVSAHGRRISTLGFGVCVGAFMIRLLADMLAWPWLVVLVVLVLVIGLGIAAWGLVVGWHDARSRLRTVSKTSVSRASLAHKSLHS